MRDAARLTDCNPGGILAILPIAPVVPVVPVRPAPSAPTAVAPIAPPRELDVRITLLLQIGVRVLNPGAHFLDALLKSIRGIGVRDIRVDGDRTQDRGREHDGAGAGRDQCAKPFFEFVADGRLVGFHRFLLWGTQSRLCRLVVEILRSVYRSNGSPSAMSNETLAPHLRLRAR